MTADPRARLATLVARDGSALSLDEACLLVAAHMLPGLHLAAEQARLDALAAGLPERTPEGLVEHLGALGFRGDADTYYDARNSLLPAVLDRRRGIPLTLAIVAIEVGRRAGVSVQGVGMPGHFLLGLGNGRFADLFHGAPQLDAAGCRAIFEALHPGTSWEDRFLRPVDSLTMVTRLVTNLATAHRRAGARPELAEALQLRLLLPGAGERERRELAVVLTASGRYPEAARVLDGLGSDRDRSAAAALRARLN